MITLLPYKIRENLKLAKRNSVLTKYIALLLAVGLFLGLYYVGMKFQINNIKESNESQIVYAAKKDQARVDKENAAKAEATSINSALSTAKNSFSHPSYFKLLTALANSMPNGSIIKTLSISNSTMKSPIQLQVLLKSNDAVSGLKEGFARNNEIFTKVSVDSVTSNNDSGEENPRYPTTATVNITINTEALK